MKRENGEVTYPVESAGGVMISEVPTIMVGATIKDVEEILTRDSKKFETINYIYVVSKSGKLRGVCSVKEVFCSQKRMKVEKVMIKEVVKVRGHTDQERVALLALKHSLKAVPVVDKEDRFLGVVPADRILQILNNEAVEDMLRMGGVWHKGKVESVLEMPISKSLSRRLPWLVLGLGGGLLAAGIVRGFEEVLSKNLILAAFIPLMVYMAGATGNQMEAFIIRELAINPRINFLKYFLRQLLIVCLMALSTGTLLLISSWFLHGDGMMSLVLAVALFGASISSVFTGLIIPFSFKKLGFDPADASGPMAMIVQDILSVMVYLGIATAFL